MNLEIKAVEVEECFKDKNYTDFNDIVIIYLVYRI
jgi:hypothetical protein